MLLLVNSDTRLNILKRLISRIKKRKLKNERKLKDERKSKDERKPKDERKSKDET